ncbi:VOC family protein [Paenibacillus faecalis]|uniref:VOC family protein n=1 Tax=Paenibacillus faecalis TaxID=2079532 RepID=UPI001F1F7C75|nr:VOC family protein [Paenibacillus faecalis]
MKTAGIHHITSFVGNPQENVDFYAGILGLRLVKKTVNYDAPEVYHFYFGNETGSPGTLMTFFPEDDMRRGKIGGGQVGITVFVIPTGSLDFWKERLTKFGIAHDEFKRFGETYIRFRDHSGLLLELTEREEGTPSTWSFGGVPADKAIKGFGGAVLFSVYPDQTSAILEELLGLERIGKDNGMIRFRAQGNIGQIIDLKVQRVDRGVAGAGTVHHIAWRAKDENEHEQFHKVLELNQLRPTAIIDRHYFNAIYFQEPGGILFEIATDLPGFTNDESMEHLGKKIMLPKWYESERQAIESHLTPVEVRVLKGDIE